MGRLYQPPHIKAALERRERAQDKLVEDFLHRMDTYIWATQHTAIQTLFHTSGQNTGGEPQQEVMAKFMERFYYDAIGRGIEIAQLEDPAKPAVKRLAAAPKGKIPADIKRVEEIFKGGKAYRRIMRRKEVLTAGLRKAYLARLKKSFKEIMPAVLANEITPAEARRHIARAWDATRARARTIFQNESTNYFNQTQVSYFSSSPSIIGFLFDSIRDAARTPQCRSRHGLVYRPHTELLRLNTPSLHYGCRSHLIPLAETPQNRRMLEDPARNPELVAVVPLPKGWRS